MEKIATTNEFPVIYQTRPLAKARRDHALVWPLCWCADVAPLAWLITGQRDMPHCSATAAAASSWVSGTCVSFAIVIFCVICWCWRACCAGCVWNRRRGSALCPRSKTHPQSTMEPTPFTQCEPNASWTSQFFWTRTTKGSRFHQAPHDLTLTNHVLPQISLANCFCDHQAGKLFARKLKGKEGRRLCGGSPWMCLPSLRRKVRNDTDSCSGTKTCCTQEEGDRRSGRFSYRRKVEEQMQTSSQSDLPKVALSLNVRCTMRHLALFAFSARHVWRLRRYKNRCQCSKKCDIINCVSAASCSRQIIPAKRMASTRTIDYPLVSKQTLSLFI